MVLCPDSLQTLPTTRMVGQSEGWQTMISWAEDYHACKTKHAYLSRWIAGQVNAPKLADEPLKRNWLGF